MARLLLVSGTHANQQKIGRATARRLGPEADAPLVMEKMPYRPELDTQPAASLAERDVSDWRQHLPVLRGKQVALRELRPTDAPALLAWLAPEEVTRFISPPPRTIEGFERFIAWTHEQRSAGTHACFAVTVDGSDTAVGIFQLRETEPAFGAAEWGFALGSAFWGTGVFEKGAELVLEFGFGTLGAHRLEARAVLENGRGNGALRKAGAVMEGVLRKSFLRNGEYLDQALYAIVADDWRARRECSPKPFRRDVH